MDNVIIINSPAVPWSAVRTMRHENMVIYDTCMIENTPLQYSGLTVTIKNWRGNNANHMTPGI